MWMGALNALAKLDSERDGASMKKALKMRIDTTAMAWAQKILGLLERYEQSNAHEDPTRRGTKRKTMKVGRNCHTTVTELRATEPMTPFGNGETKVKRTWKGWRSWWPSKRDDEEDKYTKEVHRGQGAQTNPVWEVPRTTEVERTSLAAYCATYCILIYIETYSQVKKWF